METVDLRGGLDTVKQRRPQHLTKGGVPREQHPFTVMKRFSSDHFRNFFSITLVWESELCCKLNSLTHLIFFCFKGESMKWLFQKISLCVCVWARLRLCIMFLCICELFNFSKTKKALLLTLILRLKSSTCKTDVVLLLSSVYLMCNVASCILMYIILLIRPVLVCHFMAQTRKNTFFLT